MFIKIKNKIFENYVICRNFFKTQTPLKVVFLFYFNKVQQKKEIQLYSKDKENFQKLKSNLNFQTDWFIHNIPYWIAVFKKLKIDRQRPLKLLEIGSFQGMSTIFMANYFKNATITCVDSWLDSYVKQYLPDANKISNLEKSFDNNTKLFAERINKFKGSSYDFYAKNSEKLYDLIYVDGSHYCDDVIIDAFKAFEILIPGGLMIFDDYVWDNKNDPLNEWPIGAINSFLRLKSGQYKILSVYSQLVIRKNKK